MELYIPFALREDNDLIYSPERAIKGFKYICPHCKEEVILKQGKIKVFHFAHKKDSKCDKQAAFQTSLHCMGKELFKNKEEKSIKIDTMYSSEPYIFKYETVELEKKIDDIIPDIILTDKDGRKLLVEITVTHGLDYEKNQKIQDIGIPCYEIDLSSLYKEIKKYNININEKLLESLIFSTQYNDDRIKDIKTKIEENEIEKQNFVKAHASLVNQYNSNIEKLKDLEDNRKILKVRTKTFETLQLIEKTNNEIRVLRNENTDLLSKIKEHNPKDYYAIENNYKNEICIIEEQIENLIEKSEELIHKYVIVPNIQYLENTYNNEFIIDFLNRNNILNYYFPKIEFNNIYINKLFMCIKYDRSYLLHGGFDSIIFEIENNVEDISEFKVWDFDDFYINRDIFLNDFKIKYNDIIQEFDSLIIDFIKENTIKKSIYGKEISLFVPKYEGITDKQTNYGNYCRMQYIERYLYDLKNDDYFILNLERLQYYLCFFDRYKFDFWFNSRNNSIKYLKNEKEINEEIFNAVQNIKSRY